MHYIVYTCHTLKSTFFLSYCIIQSALYYCIMQRVRERVTCRSFSLGCSIRTVTRRNTVSLYEYYQSIQAASRKSELVVIVTMNVTSGALQQSIPFLNQKYTNGKLHLSQWQWKPMAVCCHGNWVTRMRASELIGYMMWNVQDRRHISTFIKHGFFFIVLSSFTFDW